jgi:hypothetical protein
MPAIENGTKRYSPIFDGGIDIAQREIVAVTTVIVQSPEDSR